MSCIDHDGMEAALVAYLATELSDRLTENFMNKYTLPAHMNIEDGG